VKIRLLLEKDTGKEVTRHWAKPTAEQREYQKSQPGLQRLRRFHNFANELVPMSTDDMKKITQNANGGYAPGLTILGFKPRNSIPSHHSILKPFLIFPNDTEVQGSENAFMHLHAAMLRQNVLALGENLQRETSQSRLVAIYPFEETDHLPPGMYVKLLPFKDNIRKIVPDAASEELDRRKEQQKAVARNRQNNELDYPDRYGSNNAAFENDVLFSDRDSQDSITGNIASEELIKAAIDLMSRQGLSSAEIGEDFENKALTEFFSYLKSVAFDTTKEENNYDTDVNRDAVLKIAGKEIDAFRSRLPIDVERPKVSKSRKRIVKIIPDDSGIDWNELYRSDEIGTCKVDQLKKYLRSVGLSTSGRKADLVGRVTKSLEEKCTADNTISIMKKEDGNIKQEYKLLDWV
jgi:ATP-dependent DNA helicase 2 subunit 1